MRGLLFLLSAVLLSVSVSGQAVQQVNTLEDKIYGLSLLWSEIKYNFVNIDKLDFDVDRLYRETMRRVIETESDAAYYEELETFLAAFNDGHTGMSYIPKWGRRSVPRFQSTQYITYYIGGSFYFASYKMNSDETDSDLLGAEILEVEGMPAMEYAEKYVMPNIRTGSQWKKMFATGLQLLNGPAFAHRKGRALRRDGRMVDFDVVCNRSATRSDHDLYWSPDGPTDFICAPNSFLYSCEWRGDTAIVAINSFDDMDNSELLPALDSIMLHIKSRQPAALVIDLRYNGGGDTEVAWRLQMHLTDADSILSFGAQSRSNLGYGRAQGNYREEYEDYFNYVSYETFPVEKVARDKNIVPIACPVAILIGPYSFSACEDFLINIYEIPGRPVLIGECTAGSTGAPLVIDLPNEAKARICTLRAMYPYSGKPFVGGIEPDIYVQQTIDDYLKGKDTVLETALTMLALDIDLFN